MPKQKTRADGLVEKKRTINGKVRHFYGRTAREVDEKIKAAIIEAATIKEKGDNFRTVAEAFWQWKEPRIKYGTRRGYKHKIDLAVSWFGPFGMRQITATDINRELTHMANQGCAYKTISGQKSILSMIWQYWCSEMGGDQNPVPLLRLPQGLPQKKRHPPTEEEVRLVRTHPDGFGLCPAFMIYAGLRLGEVMALQKQDISKDAIHITKAVVWHSNAPVIETPKTHNSLRTVPLLTPLKDALRGRLEPLAPTDYIFGGTSPLTKSAYENAWLQYCAALGCVHDTGRTRATGKVSKSGKPLSKPIMAANFTAHQLRHEYASVLVECRIPDTVAKDLMGHSDIITTKRWYAEAKRTAIVEAGQALESYYSSHTQSEVVQKS